MLHALKEGRYLVLYFCRFLKPKLSSLKHHKSKYFIKMNEGNEKLGVGGTSGRDSNTDSNSIEYLPSPTKSENDKKEYRVIRLANKLTALLISDMSGEALEEMEFCEAENSCDDEECSSSEDSVNETRENMDDDDKECNTLHPVREEKLAALGLCVGVGSYSDPLEIQGMAHFLEHMVFMGSEKFPKENDFDAFIKKRGGSDNAETDCETTSFYFECQNRHLKEATDKFAQFFISPLMKREAMTREREAIESEFQMGITSDGNRREQLMNSLSHPDCPARKFSWGNLKTLQDNVSDNDLYTAVHEFRKRHYSAHRMTVAIQARLPLETLETLIRDSFSAVPNNSLSADDFSKFAGLALNTSEFKKIYWVKSIHDLCEVELTWALPPMQHLYRSKPNCYVEELVGHKGKGSLLAYLRRKLWAIHINASYATDGSTDNSMYTLFVINIELTEKGLSNLQEVLNAVFGYIKMLQNTGPCERFFHELQTIEETKFKFAEEVPPDENVENLAINMHFFPPEDYISGSELYFEYNPEAIKKVLSTLTPDDVNIMVSCKNPEKILDKIEPWFQTEYAVSDIPNDWRETWRYAKPDDSFKMPEPNIFLTTDLDILPITKEDESVLYPVKVHSNKLCEVWYRRDVAFKLPQAYIYLYLISPLSLSTAKNASALRLYTQILRDMLVEDLCPALLAGLYCSIISADKGIVLMFYGYNQKLHLLLDAVLKCMCQINNYLTPELFSALKDNHTRCSYNVLLKPKKLNTELRLSLVLQTYWNIVDKHAALADISLLTMKEFASDFIKHLYVKCLFQGNLSKTAAVDASNKVVETLNCAPLLPDTYPEIKVVEVPLGEHCCRVKSFNHQDTNSVVTNYYQSGLFDMKSYCILELITMLMEEPVFDVLRTKEQLGYDVYSYLRHTFGVIGFSVTVNYQAVKHSVEHVDTRIEAFLHNFSKILKKTKEKDLEEVRSSLIKLKTLCDIHLKEEVNRNWEEITSGEYLFDRQKKEVACLEGIKMPEIQKWFVNHTKHGSKHNFRKLSVQVVGTAETQKTEKQEKSPSYGRKVRKHSKDRQHQPQSELQNSIPASDTSSGYSLQFITNDMSKMNHPRKLIRSIEDFKSGLNVYPVTEIKY